MATYKILENGRIAVEDARIIFRNFEGRESRYNRLGDRNFSLVIDDPEFAEILTEKGWNVRVRPPRNEGDEPLTTLPVSVSYKVERLAPHIWQHTKKSDILLSEEDVKDMDYCEFEHIDLVINPRYWTDDKTGEDRIKAYLLELHAVLVEDYFEEKYAREEYPRE